MSKKYVIDFNNGKKFDAISAGGPDDNLYVDDIAAFGSIKLFESLGATVTEKKEPMKMSVKVKWVYEGGVYPKHINGYFDWLPFIGKKGTLTFTEDE